MNLILRVVFVVVAVISATTVNASEQMQDQKTIREVLKESGVPERALADQRWLSTSVRDLNMPTNIKTQLRFNKYERIKDVLPLNLELFGRMVLMSQNRFNQLTAALMASLKPQVQLDVAARRATAALNEFVVLAEQLESEGAQNLEVNPELIETLRRCQKLLSREKSTKPEVPAKYLFKHD